MVLVWIISVYITGEKTMATKNIEKESEKAKDSNIVVVEQQDKRVSSMPTVEEGKTLTLLEMAVRRGDSLEMVSKLMDLQDRDTARKAKEAFVRAMSGFKSEHLVIIKNKEADFGAGRAKYKYATLDTICQVAVPVMSKWGLSHNWETNQAENGAITVTCILTHSLGHSERVSLSAPPDAQNKNNCQALGSTTQYLMRYTFLAITGLSVGEGDTDANPMKGTGLPDEDKKGFIAKLSKCTTIKELEKLGAEIAVACNKHNDLRSHNEIKEKYKEIKGLIENPPIEGKQ